MSLIPLAADDRRARLPPPRRGWIARAATLGALILTAIVVLGAILHTIIGTYGKAKMEHAFDATHPGSSLHLGELTYAVGADRWVARSIIWQATNATLEVQSLSLVGAHWTRLLWGTSTLAEVFAAATLEVTNLTVTFPLARYELRCAHVRLGVPAADALAEDIELRPSMGDEDFFAASPFRSARFHVVVPECRISEIAFADCFAGSSFTAGEIHLQRPLVEALINRDKPPHPFVQRPLMVHEALAQLRPPLRIGSVQVTNGELRYCERLTLGADPAVLTIGAVNLSIAGVANRGNASDSIQLRGQGDLMNAGRLNLEMSLPILATNLSLHYSGSLEAMDLTRLNAFLSIAEHLRIKAGHAQKADFAIDVAAGEARGRVRAYYQDLEIAFLDKVTGSETGVANRVASFFANALTIRKGNAEKGSAGKAIAGEVRYTQKPDDEFQQFVWFALRTGVLDVISP